MNKYTKYSLSEKGRARQIRYKSKNKHKTAAQNKALYLHPGYHLCSVEGCMENGERHHPDYDYPEVIKWLCRKHHKLEHSPEQNCKVEECFKRSHAKGLCKNHYAQAFRKEQGW